MAMTEEQLTRLLAAVRLPPAGTDKKLTPFVTGESADWIAWKQTFLHVWRLKGWNQEVAKAQLAAAMEGAACRMVSDIPIDAAPGNPAITCLALLEAYGNRFLPPAQSRLARQGFKDAQQKADESITAWHTRVRELFQRAHPNADLEHSIELVERFLLGLYDSKVREFTFLKLPQTMAQALTEASDAAATVACLRKTDGYGSRPAVQALDAVGAVSNAKCYRCGDTGHFRRDCPQPDPRRKGRGGFARATEGRSGRSGRGGQGRNPAPGARSGRGGRRAVGRRVPGKGLAIQSLEAGDDLEETEDRLLEAAQDYIQAMQSLEPGEAEGEGDLKGEGNE